jgi:hypothetical protein
VVPPVAAYWKSTVPVGPAELSDPGEEIETVAPRATACPETEVMGSALIDVVVAAWATVSLALGEVEKAKFGSPE